MRVNRGPAGAWSTGLDDDDYACALAAAGVAAATGEGRPAPQSFGTLLPPDPLGSWPWRDPFAGSRQDPVIEHDAWLWVDAWRRWTGWPLPRLVIDPDTEDPAGISAILRRCSWPFVPMTAGTPAPSWRFPIRVGVLDTDSGRSFRAALIAAFAGSAWREHLIEPLIVGRERVRCDILILPEPASFDRREVRAATVLISRWGLCLAC